MSQSGGADNTFFLVTLYNFQKRGRAIALPAPPPPRSLNIALHLSKVIQISRQLNLTMVTTSDVC